MLEFANYAWTRLKGYEENMAYGGPTYNKNGVIEVAFASQKNFIGLYILKRTWSIDTETS